MPEKFKVTLQASTKNNYFLVSTNQKKKKKKKERPQRQLCHQLRNIFYGVHFI